MRITVFGASGKVGRLVVDKLLNNGYDVTVFVYSSNIYKNYANLKIVKGDIHNAGLVESAIADADIVISTLGSWHTETKDIVSACMRFAIPQMQKQGIKRLITLTGSAAIAPGEKLSTGGKIAHNMFSLVAKDIIRDAETHLQLLNDSGLDWTCLRAPIMRNGHRETYLLNSKSPGALEFVTRAAVAKALVDQIASRDFINQAPHIHAA